jgi:predicted enzyme involved in methoxymalonyl-ACP biosynthesis
MQKISENQGWTQKNTQHCHQSEEVQEDEELKEQSTSMDVLLNRLEERANFKKDRQAFTRFNEYFKKFNLGGLQVSTNPRKRPTATTDLRR